MTSMISISNITIQNTPTASETSRNELIKLLQSLPKQLSNELYNGVILMTILIVVTYTISTAFQQYFDKKNNYKLCFYNICLDVINENLSTNKNSFVNQEDEQD